MKGKALQSIGPKAFGLALMILASASKAAEIRVTSAELRRVQLLGTVLIVDVRPPDDFWHAHIDNAINIPEIAIGKRQLSRAIDIVVYCGEDPCPLTSGAANRLMSDGYQKVSILAGGLPAWEKAGYPVVKGSDARFGDAKRDGSGAAGRDVKGMLTAGGALAVDSRSANEFASGHIHGAVSTPLDSLERSVLPSNKMLVVCDRDQARARQAVAKLTALGYKAVELPGGLAGWVRRGLPLEVGAGAAGPEGAR